MAELNGIFICKSFPADVDILFLSVPHLGKTMDLSQTAGDIQNWFCHLLGLSVILEVDVAVFIQREQLILLED